MSEMYNEEDCLNSEEFQKEHLLENLEFVKNMSAAFSKDLLNTLLKLTIQPNIEFLSQKFKLLYEESIRNYVDLELSSDLSLKQQILDIFKTYNNLVESIKRNIFNLVYIDIKDFENENKINK